MEEKKSPLLSKTLWANAIMAVCALVIPPVSEWMASNPEGVALIFTGVNAILRLVTKSQLALK